MSHGDLTEERKELAALEGLVETAGWARMMVKLADVIEDARAVVENPKSDDRERVIQAARIQLAKDLAVFPGEQIEDLRVLVHGNNGGGE